MFRQQFVEGLNALHADQVVQLLARIREVLAQVVVHFDALFRQLGVQHLSYQWNTSATAGTGFGFGFQRGNGMAALLMAEISMPLVTSKQEQICALSGSLSTPMDGLPLERAPGGSARPGFPAARWR